VARAPNDTAVNVEYALLLMDKGAIARIDRRHATALAHYDEAAATLNGVLAREPGHEEAGFSLPQVYLGAAQVMADQAKPATEYLAKGATSTEAWAKGREANPEVQNLRLYVVRKQTMDAIGRKAHREAILHLDREIAGYEAYLAVKPDHELHKANLQIALNNKGFSLVEEKEFTAGREALIRSVQMANDMFTKDPTNMRVYVGGARSHFHMGRSWYFENQYAEAARAFEASASQMRDVVKRNAGAASRITIPYADTLYWQAKTAEAMGNRIAARQFAQALLAHAATAPAAFEKGNAAAWLAEARARVK
jgi:tetratricopeptide (TPR) repeat protein